MTTTRSHPARSRFVQTALVGALALTALGATASGASAGTPWYSDSAGDSSAGADILKVRVMHGERLRVTIQHDDLVRSARSNAGGTVFVDLRPGKPGPELALTGGLTDGTDYALVRVRDWKPVGEQLTCFHRLVANFDTDRSLFVIGRACLGEVDRARVAVRTGGSDGEGGYEVDWLNRRRHFTDWIARS
jgi:hypothetical protein